MLMFYISIIPVKKNYGIIYILISTSAKDL